MEEVSAKMAEFEGPAVQHGSDNMFRINSKFARRKKNAQVIKREEEVKKRQK